MGGEDSSLGQMKKSAQSIALRQQLAKATSAVSVIKNSPSMACESGSTSRGHRHADSEDPFGNQMLPVHHRYAKYLFWAAPLRYGRG